LSPDAPLWRDPSTPTQLGPPALEGPPPLHPVEETALARANRRWGLNLPRPNLKGLAVLVLCCVILGAVGGLVGYFSADRLSDPPLYDAGAKLVTTTPTVQRAPGSVSDIANRVLPSVVAIQVRTSDTVATGSGVVIDAKGYILTNNHVISLAATANGAVTVTYSDKSQTSARVVGRDPKSDLAVIKVEKQGLVVAALGDSSKVAIGDTVLAIGAPYGLDGTVTEGIVSALDRPVRLSGEGSDTNAVVSAIQTDAAINPGNSGGALVDTTGAVIGVNTAIKAATSAAGDVSGGNIGIGFAIPMDYARSIAEQLMASGHVTHPTLGVNVRTVTSVGGQPLAGAQVEAVTAGGAAQQAGVQDGDVITALDGAVVDSSEQLTVLVNSHKVGDAVKLTVSRGGKSITLNATLTAD
jgi:S1-C subfamily serine protease